VIGLIPELRGYVETTIHKNRLRAIDGTLHCWGCGVEGAHEVALHCPDCIADCLKRTKAQAKPKHELEHRWGSFIENMQHDQRLDAELASSLLSKAMKLEGWAKYGEALQACYTRRFGAAKPIEREHKSRIRFANNDD
jgi:hypothetical protein